MEGFAGSQDPSESSPDIPAVVDKFNKTISGKPNCKTNRPKMFNDYEDEVVATPHENEKIFSIGHSDYKIGEFIGLLKLHGIATLVDVRGNPSSKRFPQYNKQLLIASCSANNIAYRHCSQLGNKQQEIQALIELPAGQDAIKRLSEEYFASGVNATAIMCSEHDSDTCHRKIVAQRLYDDYSINTKHISRPGEISDHIVVDPNASRIRQAMEHGIDAVHQVPSTSKQNYVVDPNATRIRQAIEHDLDSAQPATGDKGLQARKYGHISQPTSSGHLPKTQRGKSILISVPQDGKSYAVSESIMKKTHETRTKRSGGSLNAYLGNMIDDDKSRTFIEECAIKAASQATSLCKSDKDFPELFQLSYKRLYDTGASNHFCGQEAANSFREY